MIRVLISFKCWNMVLSPEIITRLFRAGLQSVPAEHSQLLGWAQAVQTFVSPREINKCLIH